MSIYLFVCLSVCLFIYLSTPPPPTPPPPPPTLSLSPPPPPTPPFEGDLHRTFKQHSQMRVSTARNCKIENVAFALTFVDLSRKILNKSLSTEW